MAALRKLERRLADGAPAPGGPTSRTTTRRRRARGVAGAAAPGLQAAARQAAAPPGRPEPGLTVRPAARGVGGRLESDPPCLLHQHCARKATGPQQHDRDADKRDRAADDVPLVEEPCRRRPGPRRSSCR